VTTVQALLRTLARHEREPFYLRMDVVEYAGGEEAEAALLFADAMDDVPFMDDVAEEIPPMPAHRRLDGHERGCGPGSGDMTRKQAERLSGRLVLTGLQHVPAVVIGHEEGRHADDQELLVGWAEPGQGWPVGDDHLRLRAFLFGDEQGCTSFWWCRESEIDLLPPGAAVAPRKRTRRRK
jgi:hypothetical protein